MPTYTNLGIKKITTGDEAGTWGDSTNTNFDYFDTAIVGYVSIALTSSHTSGAPYDLNVADFLASDGRNRVIEFIGTPGVDTYVQITPNDFEGYYFVRNSVAGGYSVFVFQTNSYDAAKDIEIPNGTDFIIRCDGAGSTAAVVSSVIDNPQFTTVQVSTIKSAADNSTVITTYSNGNINVGNITEGARFNAIKLESSAASISAPAFVDGRLNISYSAENLIGYSSGNFTLTGGTTITNYYGFVASNNGFSVTNHYGFYGNIASAANRWNFYAAGTAPNYFAGDTTFNQAVTINGTTTVDILDATTANATTVNATTVNATTVNATDVNNVTITAPASSATLTIADGKTATVDNSITFSGTDSTTMTFPEINASIGFRNIPVNPQASDYTLDLTDSGKYIYHNVGTAAATYTIPAQSSVNYDRGTVITFVNFSVNPLTIDIDTDTLLLAGTGATGARTLAQWGVATAIKITGSGTIRWLISGTGLT